MSKISVEEILNRHEYLARVQTDGQVDLKVAIKKAIKEIVEKVVDKCAEDATTYTDEKAKRIGSESGVYEYVDKQSILAVKEEVDYGEAI